MLFHRTEGMPQYLLGFVRAPSPPETPPPSQEGPVIAVVRSHPGPDLMAHPRAHRRGWRCGPGRLVVSRRARGAHPGVAGYLSEPGSGRQPPTHGPGLGLRPRVPHWAYGCRHSRACARERSVRTQRRRRLRAPHSAALGVTTVAGQRARPSACRRRYATRCAAGRP